MVADAVQAAAEGAEIVTFQGSLKDLDGLEQEQLEQRTLQHFIGSGAIKDKGEIARVELLHWNWNAKVFFKNGTTTTEQLTGGDCRTCGEHELTAVKDAAFSTLAGAHAVNVSNTTGRNVSKAGLPLGSAAHALAK